MLIRDRILSITMASCLIAMLIPVFTDGITLGPWTYDSMMPPLFLLLALAFLALCLNRDRIPEWHRRVVSLDRGQAVEDWTKRPLAALLVIGFLLRVARSPEFGLNPDEAQLVWAAKCASIGDIWDLMVTRSPHPPAYPLLLHVLMYVSEDLMWLRLPSIVAGTFVIWMSYRFAREIWTPSAGLAMAVLVTFSPSLIDLSRVCRNYSIAFALIVSAFYFLAKFLRVTHWRALATYVVLATLATVFHYVMAVAVAGGALGVVLALAQRRVPWKGWIKMGILHLPFVTVLGFLYWLHIAQLSHSTVRLHQTLNRSVIAFAPSEIFRPLTGVFNYLLPDQLVGLFFALACLGAVILALNRNWIGIFLCFSPILMAYVFLLAAGIPLGHSRHGAYLFPFLFGLVVSLVPAAIAGLERNRGPFAGESGHGARAGPARLMNLSRSGLVASIGIAVLFTVLSLAKYDAGAEMVKSYFPVGEAKDEFLTYYRQRDAMRAFDLLEEHVGENDIVLVTFPALMALRLHVGMTPIVHPTPAQMRRQDFGLPIGRVSARRFGHENVNFFYSPRFSFASGVGPLFRGLRDVRRRFRVSSQAKVWVLHGGWEESMNDHFAKRFPDAPVEKEIAALSNGLIFCIEMKELRQLRRSWRKGRNRDKESDAPS